LPAGLHLVATPIGNAADITLRALDILTRADVVACEDTRHTQKLLGLHGISRARGDLLPYHDHNAEQMRPRLLQRLAEGAVVALVSDAGTPCISDPGYKLVRAAVADGHAVTAAPGPNAALTALVLSGLPTDRFLFAGFPPPKSGARRRFFEELRDVPASLVFYEGPSRVAACLADLTEVLGERPAALARELTKRFEEVRRAPLSELAAHFAADGPPRGEVVIVVGPPAPPTATGDADLDAMLRTALGRLSVRDAASEVARMTGLPRRGLYARALALAGSDE
jgi:16S rRNA (cytidine1402-2'-O)-methyltransferase